MAVIDLEMNQPSGTIIQIGAVVYDRFGGIPDPSNEQKNFNRVCNPGELPSPFITELTGISRKDVEEAQPLHAALKAFWKWLDKACCGRKIGAWGNDVEDLMKASRHYKIPFQTGKILDVKQFVNMHSHIKHGTPFKMGLKNAVAVYCDDKMTQHHDAWSDALDTVRVLTKVIEEMG